MLTPEQVLELIPQQRPFRFIDRLVELTEATAVGEYPPETPDFAEARAFEMNVESQNWRGAE